MSLEQNFVNLLKILIYIIFAVSLFGNPILLLVDKKMPKITKRDEKGKILKSDHQDMIGNKYAEKFKTSRQRKKLCQAYCEHIGKGYNKESFIPCDMQTFNRYRKVYPEDFDTISIEEAERKGMLVREKVLFGVATGKINGKGSAQSTHFALKNKRPKFWRDKQEVNFEGKSKIVFGLPASQFTDGTLAQKRRDEEKKKEDKDKV